MESFSAPAPASCGGTPSRAGAEATAAPDPGRACEIDTKRVRHANHQPARAPRPRGRGDQEQVAGDAELSAAPRGMHARLHDDAEETKLYAAQCRQGST